MAGRGRRAPRTAAPKLEGAARMCIGCRGSFLRDTLIRIIRGPAGEIGVDRYLKAPGRGAHLCYSRGCIEAAVKRKAIGRAFPGVPGPNPPPDVDTLVSQVVDAIDARIRDALTLGRLRGLVTSGADALDGAFTAGRLALVVLATDTAENSAHRWAAREKAAELPLVHFSTAAELGRTQGAETRIAVGVTDAALAQTILSEFERRSRVLVAS
ncbi:DUF448 domain-containing protein [Myxococcota bacterium]|nr:DUF448 domain-containing protein [Myxococcota bacterium]